MFNYRVTGKRFVREYRSATMTPTYSAAADAEKIATTLCDVAWKEVAKNVVATMPAHAGNAATDADNVSNQQYFDAALFCGEHTNGQHRAFANAACYRFTMPDSAVGVTLAELRARIFSDPYNAAGARVALFTSDDPDVPTACQTCRRGSSDDMTPSAQSNNGSSSVAATEWYSTNTHVEGVAPRRSDGTSWYANSGTAVIRPQGGIELGKYLFVFVLLENYGVARNGYLEGASYAINQFEIAVEDEIEGWSVDVTEDASIAPASQDFNVVKGGVYPAVVGAVSGVQSIQLQRTGDVLRSSLTQSETKGTEGLRKLLNGHFSTVLNVDAASITCIHPIWAAGFDGNQNSAAEYIAIGGTFDGGTIPGISGLYIYDPRTGEVITNCTVASSAVIPESMATFIRDHGGLALAACAPVQISTSGSLNRLSFVCKDGAYFGNITNNLIEFPILFYYSRSSFTISGYVETPVRNLGQLFGTSYAIDVTCSPDTDILPRTINGANRSDYTFDFAIFIRKSSRLLIGDSKTVFLNGIVDVAAGSVMELKTSYEVVGTVNRIAPQGPWDHSSTTSTTLVMRNPFIVSGELISVGGVACTNLAYVGPSQVVSPFFKSDVSPDAYDGYSVFGQILSKTFTVGNTATIRFTSSSVYVTGNFSKLGGNSAYSKIARVLFDGTMQAVDHPESDTVAAVAFFDLSGFDGSRLHAGTPVVIGGNVVYADLNDDVTDEQSAVGLRIAYAKLFTGGLSKVARAAVSPDGSRPGAMFVVRANVVNVPVENDGEVSTVSVPTWQITTSKLVVPFSLPTAFGVSGVKLTWSQLANATSGARLNVWMKNQYVEECPDISDSAIYDASRQEVDGWKLLGTVSPADLSAVLPVEFVGKVATLMFTAWVNLDDVNPATGMTFPKGVGNIDVDGVNGTVTGAGSGWRPDVALV